jgi:hypothetical protein
MDQFRPGRLSYLARAGPCKHGPGRRGPRAGCFNGYRWHTNCDHTPFAAVARGRVSRDRLLGRRADRLVRPRMDRLSQPSPASAATTHLDEFFRGSAVAIDNANHHDPHASRPCALSVDAGSQLEQLIKPAPTATSRRT